MEAYTHYFIKGRNDSTGKSSFPEQCIGLVDLLLEDGRIASQWLNATTSDAIKSTGLTLLKINARVKEMGKKSLNPPVNVARAILKLKDE